MCRRYIVVCCVHFIFYFLHVFISFKYDFHNDNEGMDVKAREM